jgi:hypothetical protein
MAQQRVLQFEYQQSLLQDSERCGWSEDISVSVRLFSDAITSGWYRARYSSHGNDFVILLAIAMHARPLKGDDLDMLVNLHMAKPGDEGRLYARVSDVALADELGMSRTTVSRACQRLADDKSINILEIPKMLSAFRDSHGRFNGTKVYLIAGDIQSKFLEKSIQNVNRAAKSGTVEVADDRDGVRKSRTLGADHDSNDYRSAQDSRINVLEKEDDEEVATATVTRIFSYFAMRKGDPDYHPTIKEQIALEKLVNDGFTFEQIVAGIEVAFIRPFRPRYFTHCAAITRDLIHLQQETRKFRTRQPEKNEPEALREMDLVEGKSAEVIEPHLELAVQVYRSSGRDISHDLLARFRLMAERCEQAAQQAGTTGGAWLADALTRALGVALPRNLLNYADAVLSDWISNGRIEKRAIRTEKPDSNQRASRNPSRRPAAHVGIREYLEKHGGIPDGVRD